MEHFDVIVIGAGSGLNISAATSNNLGLKTAIVEKGPMGGTCLNRGCIPSKMVIHAADVAETIDKAKVFGINPKGYTVDFRKVTERASKMVDKDARSIEAAIRANKKMTLFKTEGKFVGYKTLQVGNKKIKGDKIIIAAGTRPFIPPVEGLKEVDYMTSTEALRLTKQPKSLTIIGGGYIAAELAHFYGALGTKINIIQRRGVLIPNEDEEVAKRAANHETIQSYEGERIDLGGYFFATDSEGDWHFPDRIKSTSGRVVRIFRNLHNITGDVRFAELEEQAASHIKFNKERERGLEPIRCLHADRDILKAARYFYERGAYNPEIGFYDIGSAFYSRFGNQVAENERIISAHSLEMILPLILEASKRTTDPDLAAAYREHIIRHTDAIEKYLIRQDDTIRDLAKFNLETGEITEGNYWSHSPEASTSLYQAIAVDWFAIMFELTGNEEYQKTARKLIQPYILTLPSDYIPYFVIPRGTGIPKDMPRNTAAALRMGLALQNHPWLLPQQQRDSLFYGTLKSVIVNHADTNPNTDAIITSMCYNYRTKSYMNSCIVWGVDSFIEIVRGIKEKD